MFTRWIHKNGKSRPDKRYKSYKSQSKTNGARKRKKKWEERLIGIFGE